MAAQGSDSTNSKHRLFAIGDVHGCARELSALLEKLRPAAEDTVVFLGDYIDRGPDSKGVVDLILDLKKRCQVVALKGNHEAMLLDFLDHPDTQGAGMFVLNGGSTTLASYTVEGGSYQIPDEHLEFFRTLKICYQTESHFFVHAGLPLTPIAKLNMRDPELQMQMVWMRQPFLSTPFKWEKIIVHGHTPTAKVENLPNRINLDTGCVYGNSLTALELPANVFHSVEKGVKRGIDLPRDIARISQRFAGNLPVRAARAGHRIDPDQAQRHYETLNYNQFGLLMREVGGPVTPPGATIPAERILSGDSIEGEIGSASGLASDVVKFKGHVVRTDSRGEFVLYAIRIDKISGGIWGPDWIERPAS